jgi:hypothetical protein
MIFEILTNPIYTYLFILTLVIFLVIFIWRKLTILESNFYILEKRVNLIKETIRPVNIASSNNNEIFSNVTEKKIERSNMVMNEIFGNISKKCNKKEEDIKISFDIDEIPDAIDIEKMISEEDTDTTIVEEVDEVKEVQDPISYNNVEETGDFDNKSSVSEFIFNSDEKYTQKKLSKLNMEKLKNICEKMNISSEGNKNQLIARILE